MISSYENENNQTRDELLRDDNRLLKRENQDLKVRIIGCLELMKNRVLFMN